MPSSRAAVLTLAGLACVATLGAGPVAVAASSPAPSSAPQSPTAASSGLPLGPADLAETRHTTTLQTGLTLTRITRGATDPDLTWTEEMLIPAGADLT